MKKKIIIGILVVVAIYVVYKYLILGSSDASKAPPKVGDKHYDAEGRELTVTSLTPEGWVESYNGVKINTRPGATRIG